MLWKKREGSFAPEINACNQTLDEFARACARSDHEKAAALAAKMEMLLAALKAVKVCGKEAGS